MHSFKAGFINELLLMLYRKKTIAFLLVSLLLPILLALSLHALQPVLGLMAVSQSFPVEMLSMSTLFWIPLFIFLTTADLFPSEIASRTLKLSLLRPITRFRVFASKAAALFTGIVVLLLVLGIVTFACSLFAGTNISASEWAGAVKAYAAAGFSMMVLATVFIFISQFFKSASGSLVFSLILYAAAKAAPFFYRPFSVFSPASYTDWHMLWLSESVSGGRLFTTSLYLLSSFVLFFSLGYFMFDKKEA